MNYLNIIYNINVHNNLTKRRQIAFAYPFTFCIMF